MGETPFEPFFHGPPERRRVRRGSHRLPLERSFRCRASLRAGDMAPVSRYEEFVRLHEAMSTRPKARASLLWFCGFSISLIVAALMMGAVGLLRGPLGVQAPLFVPEDVGVVPAACTMALCGAAAVLMATALLHVLILIAERPVRGFAGIGAMTVTLATLLPLTLRVPPEAALATGALNLVGGTATIGMLALIASACVYWPDPPRRRRRYRDH